MAVNSLKGIAEDILYTPSDIISNPDSADVVLEFGFRIALQTTEGPQTITELINSSAGIENRGTIAAHCCQHLIYIHSVVGHTL